MSTKEQSTPSENPQLFNPIPIEKRIKGPSFSRGARQSFIIGDPENTYLSLFVLFWKRKENKFLLSIRNNVRRHITSQRAHWLDVGQTYQLHGSDFYFTTERINVERISNLRFTVETPPHVRIDKSEEVFPHKN